MSDLFAQVLVDIDAPHLDQLYDYRVPEELSTQVRVGSRVKVRFGSRLVSGYVAGLEPESSFSGRVAPLSKLVSQVPVFTPELFSVVDYFAVRHCASRSQILSFVSPTRVAAVDKQMAESVELARAQGRGIFASSSRPREEKSTPPKRLVRNLGPGELPKVLLETVVEEKSVGKSALILMPTAHGATTMADSLASNTELRISEINNDQGPTVRYRNYLRCLLGEVDVLVGTRSAVWTALPALGSILIWDDGDDRYRERRSPRYDVLDVAVARSHIEGLNLISLSYARSLKSQALVTSGWAASEGPERTELLSRIPKLQPFDSLEAQREGASGFTRLPDAAYRMIRTGLQSGPVLIQVPASGYVTDLEENRKRIGSDRIGEELQAAFKEAPVLVSSSTAGILRQVAGGKQIVVATAGAEPTAKEGYSAVLITGASGQAYSPNLDGPLEACRRWMAALALARPGAPGLVVGDIPKALWDALVLWRSERLAEDALQQRRELGFPPARWVCSIEGPQASVDDEVTAAARILGRPQFHLPGEAFAPLSILGEDYPQTEDGSTDKRVVLSVEPKNTQVFMAALGEARRELSGQGRPLPRFGINPQTLALVEE